jgi:hypothetical protein
MAMVYGETDKGRQWLLDNIESGSVKKNMGPVVVTRTFQIELLNDMIEEFNKAGLTIED